MPELVSRPTFYEGQILAPDDLNGSLDYGRVGLAQHERYLHTPGIATGLELIAEPQAGPNGAFVTATCAPGMAIDATGRQIVVPASQPLNEGLFSLLNPDAADDEWFPVFLVGLDEEMPPTASLGGACDTTAASRVSEAFEITFGRVGEEQLLAEQQPPAVGEGPGGAPGEPRPKVLLGFVRWGPQPLNRFVEVKAKPDAIGPTYAGVAADTVQARGGELTIRARRPTEAGKPAVVVTEQDGGELRFGLQDANGNVKPVFRVTSAGDVIADGKVKGELPTGVHVESGIATDGVLLPLPKEVKPEQVERDQVVVHVHVTPRWDNLTGGFILPLVCTAEDRRVQCRFLDFNVGANVPGRCDYTVLAVVSSEEGS